MPIGTPLTIDEQKGRLENLKRLLGAHFGNAAASNIERLQKTPIEIVNAAYAKLVLFGVEPKEIASWAQLLSRSPETIQRNYDFLNQTMKLTPEMLVANAHLLGRDPDSLQRNYDFLNKTLKLTPEKIASQAQLLGRDPDSLRKNFDFLNKELGLSPEQIVSQAQLLGRDPDSLQRNFNFLNKTLHLIPEQIRTAGQILGKDPETLQRNFDFLNKTLKLTSEKIASSAGLLGISPRTLQKNWQNLRRYLDADIIRSRATTLLGIPPSTTDGNAQFLSDHSIGTDRYLLYMSSPRLKREKMAWIVRNILSEYERREAVSKVRRMVSRNPTFTIYPSVKQLERTRERIQRLAERV